MRFPFDRFGIFSGANLLLVSGSVIFTMVTCNIKLLHIEAKFMVQKMITECMLFFPPKSAPHSGGLGRFSPTILTLKAHKVQTADASKKAPPAKPVVCVKNQLYYC